MAAALSIEERLTILEKEMADLKQTQTPAQDKHNWLEKITGTFRNDPAFGEILRLGREIRKAETQEESDGDD